MAYSALIAGPYHDPIWPPTASIRPRGGRQCPLYVRNTVSCIAPGNTDSQGHACINTAVAFTSRNNNARYLVGDFEEIKISRQSCRLKIIRVAKYECGKIKTSIIAMCRSFKKNSNLANSKTSIIRIFIHSLHSVSL